MNDCMRACDVENEVLRNKLSTARNEAKQLKKLLVAPGYINKKSLEACRRRLENIINC